MAGKADYISMSGDSSVLAKLVSLTDKPDPDFAVVTLSRLERSKL
jgi:hypothetical protein